MSLNTYDNVISYDMDTDGVYIGTSSDYILLLEEISTSDSQTTEEIINAEYGTNYYYHPFNGSYYGFSLDSGTFTIYATREDWGAFITQKRIEVENSRTMTDREVILALGLKGGLLVTEIQPSAEEVGAP